jgi:uncharacterized protein YdhG (YjbR/CyaY superfamily)
MLKFVSIDQYIDSFPLETQIALNQIRSILKEVVPQSMELISYNMPAIKLKKVLVYYAAYKNHIGFYPTSSWIKAFENDITEYKHSKGAIQFPLNEPLPLELIKKITLFRLLEVQGHI